MYFTKFGEIPLIISSYRCCMSIVFCFYSGTPNDIHVMPFGITLQIPEALFNIHHFFLCSLDYIFSIALSLSSLTLPCHIHCATESPSSHFKISGIIVFNSRRSMKLYFIAYISVENFFFLYTSNVFTFTSWNTVKISGLKLIFPQYLGNLVIGI